MRTYSLRQFLVPATVLGVALAAVQGTEIAFITLAVLSGILCICGLLMRPSTLRKNLLIASAAALIVAMIGGFFSLPTIQ